MLVVVHQNMQGWLQLTFPQGCIVYRPSVVEYHLNVSSALESASILSFLTMFSLDDPLLLRSQPVYPVAPVADKMVATILDTRGVTASGGGRGTPLGPSVN